MIKYEELDFSKLDTYETIDFRFTTDKIYQLNKINNGLGGILLEEKNVKQFTKDFGKQISEWTKKVSKVNWKMYVAKDNDKLVGGCIIATKTKDVHMLEGRDDLAVLFDIRVIEEYKSQGIGYHLFNLAKYWSKKNGFRQLKIECQSSNYNAVNFYHRQGAILCSIKEFEYADYPNEVQLLWYLNL